MNDGLTTIRCPRCGAPTEEFMWHPHGVLQPPVSRFECLRCDWISERGSLGAPRSA